MVEEVKNAESKTKPKMKGVNVLLPCLALAYLPFVYLVGTVASNADSTGGFVVFVFSGMALLVLIHAYAVTILKLTGNRIKNGTNTTRMTLFQIFPLIVYIFLLVAVLTFEGSPV